MPEIDRVLIRDCHFYGQPLIYGGCNSKELENCRSENEFNLHSFPKTEPLIKNVKGHYSLKDMFSVGRIKIEISHLEAALIPIKGSNGHHPCLICRLEQLEKAQSFNILKQIKWRVTLTPNKKCQSPTEDRHPTN